MIFSLFTKKKKNTDYNEMDAFIEKDIKETTIVSDEEEEQKQENKEDVIKKARDLLKEAINFFT